MVVRGRLAFDDDGRLVEIAEDAEDPENPQPEDIDPVEMDEAIIHQLVGAMDADGNDITNVGEIYSARETVDELGVRIYADGNQTIPSGSFTQVGFDEFDYEDDSEFFTADLANDYIEIDEAGRYLIDGAATVDSGSTGYRWITAVFAGDEQLLRDTRLVEQAELVTGNPSITAELSAGDTVELEVFQDSGSDKTLDGGDPFYTWLSVNRLG